MKLSQFAVALFLAAITLSVSPLMKAASAASPADKTFAGKVSQGGMYEVEASKVAGQKATAQDVKDVAAAEVHDHGLVNSKLKKIATGAGVPIAGQLNAEFQ